MWIVAYDPADERDLLQGGISHWLLRHGSPFHRDSEDFVAANWIPITAIPSLRELATSSDFILIAAPEVETPRRHKIWTSEDPPTRDVIDALKNSGREEILLSIEFTYNMDFGSNTIARANNVIQPALEGVPSFITMPSSAVALRGNKRLGNKNERQREWEAKTSDACRSLVESNTPVEYGTVSEFLDMDDLPIDAINNGSWKMDLMMAVVGDTWDVAASVINLPETAVYFPDRWKLSGCQLMPIYDLIRSSVNIWENEGRRIKTSDSAVWNLRAASEQKIAWLGPPLSGGRRSRNPEWDQYCTRIGYPPQSRCDFQHNSISGQENLVMENHHTLLSPELTVVRQFDTSLVANWNRWAGVQSIERNGQGQVLHNGNKQRRLASLRERDFGNFDVDLLPDELKERGMVATLHISDHTARGNAPLHQNLIERTYLGRAEMMDLVNFRRYVGSEGRPRAVVDARRERWVIFALDLPISSTQFENFSNTNANIGLWYKMADIYVLEDGIFLGREWTRGKLLRLA